jgi:hypothetical protein
MQTKIDVVMASTVGSHIAVVCHVEGDLSVDMVLNARNKQGHWKVTSLGWPTLAQAHNQTTKKGVVLLPLGGAEALHEGDVLLSEQVSKAAA